MGNNTSINTNIDSLIENITNMTISNLQSNISETSLEQVVAVDCSEDRKILTMEYSKCAQQCLTSSNQGISPKLCAEIVCSPLSPSNLACTIEDAKLMSFININISDQQYSNITSNITNKVKDTVKSTLDQTGSSIPFSNTTINQKINDVTRTISDTLINSALNQLFRSNQVQAVVLKGGGTIKNVTIDSSKTIIKSSLQSNTVLQQQWTDLTKEITSTVTQKGDNLADIMKYVMYVIYGIGGIIFIIILYKLINKFTGKKDKNKKDKGGDDKGSDDKGGDDKGSDDKGGSSENKFYFY